MSMDIEKKVLTTMARRNNGVLLVDDVLNEAKDESSPLHKHFEWDDTEAAEQYRRQQARVLIQRCKITLLDTDPVQVRAFVSLPTDRENGGGYRLTATVLGDEGQKAELLRDIQLTIQRWSRKLNLLDRDVAEALEQLESRVDMKLGADQRSAA